MEKKATQPNGVTPANRGAVRVADGVEYVIVSPSSGPDWAGRYGRRPQPKLKSEGTGRHAPDGIVRHHERRCRIRP